MKTLRTYIRVYNSYVKKIITFCLSIFLLSKACKTRTPSIIRYTLDNIKDNQLQDSINNLVDISLPDSNGRDWLLHAIDCGDIEKISLVLNRISDDKECGTIIYTQPNFPNHIDPKSKQTPLGQAIKKGDHKIVALLVRNQYININKVDDSGITSLLTALQNNNNKIAQCLLRASSAQHPLDVISKHPSTHNTPLHLAVANGNDATIKLLLTKEVTEGSLRSQDKKGRTPLQLAAHYRNKTAFQEIFNKTCQLCESKKNEVYMHLDKHGPMEFSLFAYSYMLEIDHSPISGMIRLHSTNSDFFKYVMNTVGSYLSLTDILKIVKEIDFYENHPVYHLLRRASLAAELRKIAVMGLSSSEQEFIARNRFIN